MRKWKWTFDFDRKCDRETFYFRHGFGISKIQLKILEFVLAEISFVHLKLLPIKLYQQFVIYVVIIMYVGQITPANSAGFDNYFSGGSDLCKRKNLALV